MKARELRQLPSGTRFRLLVDLEPGECVENLPTYTLAIHDKIAVGITPHRHSDRLTVIVKGYIISTLHEDTEVEIIPRQS
jgi:hypothetical protein